MLFKSSSRYAFVLFACGGLTAALVAGETRKPAQLEREGVRLLGQLEDVARDVRLHADHLQSYGSYGSSAQPSKWIHYHQLERIKSLVNDGLRPTLTRLTEIQPHLPAWRQDAIDQLLASARALAAATNLAILNLNDAGAAAPFIDSEYRELVARIYQHSDSLVNASDAAGDYATAHRQAVEAGLK